LEGLVLLLDRNQLAAQADKYSSIHDSNSNSMTNSKSPYVGRRGKSSTGNWEKTVMSPGPAVP
jgi:hypothetical protein